jgi:predicted alpha/beta-fold hydrolase
LGPLDQLRQMPVNGFAAPGWCRNAHCQTIWPLLGRKHLTVPWQRQRLELPDGDFLDLDWHGPDTGTTPIVLVLHGLEGSSRSHYARAMGSALPQHGFRVAVMNFRGCSGSHNRLTRSYHSGETGDIDYVTREIKKRHPDAPLFVVGFSLGGNVLLKWLGEQKNVTPVKAAVAVSVPFDLGVAADRMSQGLSRIYQQYFLNSLIPKIVAKNRIIKLPVDVQQVSKAKTLREYDNYLTAPLHGFADAQDYYTRSSSRQFLGDIKIPAWIIHSRDDPFMTTSIIPKQDEVSETVTLGIHDHGGHVGFLGKQGYWLDQAVPAFFMRFTRK